MSDIDDAVERAQSREKLGDHESRIAELERRADDHREELGRVDAKIEALKERPDQSEEIRRELRDAIAEHARVSGELRREIEALRENKSEPESEEEDGAELIEIVESDEPAEDGDVEDAEPEARTNRGFFAL